MKKRDYLSPHTWQQSDVNNLNPFASGPKRPLKIGRYIAFLILIILILFLLFHHSNNANNSNNSKSSTTVAALNPTIQTITLPALSQTA
jgi:hypothetical protein